MWHAKLCSLAALGCAGAVVFSLLANLGYPLLWNDEAETAMYAERIIEFGYPRVHDGFNVVYEAAAPIDVAVKRGAYIGSTWGQYYFAVPGALLARALEDPHTKTFAIRIPFAVAGATGLALFWSLVLSAAPGARGRRMGMWVAFSVLCASSVSLVLHLRQARHYPIVTMLVACILVMHVAKWRSERLRYPVFVGLQASLLFLLFNVFSLPYAVLTLALGLDAVLRLVRERRQDAAWSQFLRRVAPLALAGAAVLPVVGYFETQRIARALSEPLAESRFLFQEHLGIIVSALTANDFLAPALIALGGALWLARRNPNLVREPELHTARGVSNLLWLVVLVWVLVVAALPFSFERYWVPVGPILIVVLLIEASMVWEMGSRGSGAERRIAGWLVGAGVAAALVVSLARLDQIRGLWEELRVPVRGPVDFVVAFLESDHAQRKGVIATDYEAVSLMYYLPWRVVKQRGQPVQCHPEPPDFLLPRLVPLAWSPLRRYRGCAEYERVDLSAARWPYNNIPQLTPQRFVAMTHRFRTDRATPAGYRLALFRRVSTALPGRATPDQTALPRVP